MKKTGRCLIVFLVLTILYASFSLAFGVSSSNWKGNPLVVNPGAKETISPLMLQNMVGTNDITVRAKIINGSEIASLEKTEFNVKAGTKDTTIPIKLNIPENAKPGTLYSITISFASVTAGETGVVLGTGMDTSFDILIAGQKSEEKTSSRTLAIILLIAFVILVIAAIIIIKKRKKHN